jgi:hypothetical protein
MTRRSLTKGTIVLHMKAGLELGWSLIRSPMDYQQLIHGWWTGPEP